MEFFRQDDGLTFEAENHIYRLKGERLISLTQILQAAGLVDYSHVDPGVLANKAAFGTKVHEYCLWLDQGEIEMDELKPWPNYWNRVEGWRQFREDFQFTPDANWCEVPCAVKVNGMLYAMTIDRFGVFGDPKEAKNGKSSFGVVEIKTTADTEPSHHIQTAGQTIPFKGDGSVPVKRYACYLLDQPRSGKYYFLEEHTDRTDERIFLAALMLTQFRINNKLMKGIQ
jgi:hypothetical protein